MSAVANIAIQDGEAAPVTHTYAPKASMPNPLYREDTSNVPLAGQGRIVVISKASKTSDGMNRVRLQLVLPVMEAITNQNSAGYTAALKVAYEVTANVDFILPMRSTVQNRKNVRTLVKNLLADAQVIDLVVNLAVPY